MTTDISSLQGSSNCIIMKNRLKDECQLKEKTLKENLSSTGTEYTKQDC